MSLNAIRCYMLLENQVTVLGVRCIAFRVLGILTAIIGFKAGVGEGLISEDSEAMAITAPYQMSDIEQYMLQ